MKYAIIILLAATIPLPLQAGSFSGETTVTARLTVGAASSCSGSVTETAISTTLPKNMPKIIGTIWVNCPGATNIYAGLVGGNGDVGLRMGTVPNSDKYVQAPYWLNQLALWGATNASPIYMMIGGTKEFINNGGQDPSLPTNVKSLAQIPGSEDSFALRIEGDSCNPCNLKTGSYTYQIKIFGYWS